MAAAIVLIMAGFTLTAVMLITAGSAVAAPPDAMLYFTGEIIQSSCRVDSESVNRTIQLGTARTTDFDRVGSIRNPTAFNVKLANCMPGTRVTMTVSGQIDPNSGVLKNTGSAAQVGVQLLLAKSQGDTTGGPIMINGGMSLGSISTDGTMTIPMVAQFYRLGDMTSGSVSAIATVDFVYN